MKSEQTNNPQPGDNTAQEKKQPKRFVQPQLKKYASLTAITGGSFHLGIPEPE